MLFLFYNETGKNFYSSARTAVVAVAGVFLLSQTHGFHTLTRFNDLTGGLHLRDSS